LSQTATAKKEKAADAFRTISEAASELDVPQHVLRHWEEVFGQIRPMRRAGGRRYYRPIEIDILRGVRVLLYDQRFTTRGVQKIFKDNGAKYIAEIGRLAAAGEAIALRPIFDEDDADRAVAPPVEDMPANADPAYAARLEGMLEKLERAQRSLDDAIAAIEAIRYGGDD
jgi:DNA-binding transcriptional MerR regulator